MRLSDRFQEYALCSRVQKRFLEKNRKLVESILENYHFCYELKTMTQKYQYSNHESGQLLGAKHVSYAAGLSMQNQLMIVGGTREYSDSLA